MAAIVAAAPRTAAEAAEAAARQAHAASSSLMAASRGELRAREPQLAATQEVLDEREAELYELEEDVRRQEASIVLREADLKEVTAQLRSVETAIRRRQRELARIKAAAEAGGVEYNDDGSVLAGCAAAQPASLRGCGFLLSSPTIPSLSLPKAAATLACSQESRGCSTEAASPTPHSPPTEDLTARRISRT